MFGAGNSLQGGRGFRGDWGISGALVSPRNDAVLPAGRRGLGLPAPCPPPAATREALVAAFR